jgi:HK97 family phage portal protein
MAETTFMGALEKALVPRRRQETLSPINPSRGGWYRILESFSGAWQQNVEIKYDSVLSFHADFACRTLIASDIAKLRIRLVEQNAEGVWIETKNPAYSPVLRKPNHFQNRIQFMECWVLSKLQRGNTYILKQRDNRNVVAKMYVLDPLLVTPLVAEDGSVFYEINTDSLSGIPEATIVVPAREIIHDRFNCFFHPLVGLSPIFAGGLASMHGLAIQNVSTKFFENGAQPGGVLTAPGAIANETATRLKEYWDTNFSGKKVGRIAVLGDGLKYEPMSANAVDSQLLQQLKWSAEVVASTYHVPPYKIGVGQLPTYNNVQALNIEYYSQCLQVLIEAIELCLDEGLGMGETIGTDLDLDGLLRMDSVTQLQVLDKAKNLMTLDERRKRLNYPAMPLGGATVYLQKQDHSLEAIAARDRQLIDAADRTPPPEVTPAAASAPDADVAPVDAERSFGDLLRKELGEWRPAA